MFKASSASFAAALLLGMSGSAFAQAAAPAPAANAAPARVGPDPNEIICEKQEVLGSRLASRRICHTRAEWADLKLQDRQELERVQSRRGMKGE
jgi:hypothetical protein